MQELSKEQKEALAEVVSKVGFNIFDREEKAKAELTMLCKEAEEESGIKAAVIKKMVKTHYKASMEEEATVFQEFEELYRELMDNVTE
ncbi:MAG: hypothetical protein GY799_21160 [Desulfobulbaceae bacterium]|nr:hypothetical protein [Desulfobulbaceae bacterium]